MQNPFRELGVSDAELEAALNDPEINDAKIALAQRVTEYWKRIAPVRTGEYRDSIHVEIGSDHVVRVVADDVKAEWIEYGTSDTPEFAPRSKTQARFREDQ